MNNEMMKDIVEWDIYNWSRAIDFWEKKADLIIDKDAAVPPSVLDIGGRNGGISLYWAMKGCKVVCSDIDAEGLKQAKQLHEKYQVSDLVEYEVVDSTSIPYENHFDIICLKSVLGAVYGEGGGPDAVKQMMREVYNALKPGGYFFVAENLAGSRLHMFLRRNLRRWGRQWHYFRIREILDLLSEFEEIEYDSFGSIGLFGRTEGLSRAFSRYDARHDHKIKEDHRYIISLVCRKPKSGQN